MPKVVIRHGLEPQVQIAIEEWMAASPIYSKRTQRALELRGQRRVDRVQEPPARHRRAAPVHGLPVPARPARVRRVLAPRTAARCMDVEPYGEERVRHMCHDIEDPTFDATAAATHPCMKMRPIHRPPREPAAPLSALPLGGVHRRREHARSRSTRTSRSCRSRRPRTCRSTCPRATPSPGGWADYSGPFDPGFQLEDLSHRALVIANQEFALQSHLLARGFMLCCAQRFGDDAASELAEGQWTGIAALTAGRLREPRAAASTGDDIEAVAKIFQIHPCFFPRTYVDFSVEITGPQQRADRDRRLPRARGGRPVLVVRGAARRAAPRARRDRGRGEPARALPSGGEPEGRAASRGTS